MKEELKKEDEKLRQESEDSATMMTSGQSGPKTQTGIDKKKLRLIGGFLRHRLEDDPFYVAKLFIKMLGKNIWRILLRITIILSLAYIIRYLIVTYTTIPSFYSTLILIFIIIVYYTRTDQTFATKYMIRIMIVLGADRFITHNLGKPPGTMIVLLLVGGVFYMTYSGIFKKVKEDAEHEPT